MHLLAVTSGTVSDGAEAVDLGQTPGELVVLTAADSEIACLAVAARRRPQAPTLRLANLLRLGHPMSVDLHVDKVVRHAKLVVVRLLGGRGYWPYGVEQIAQACRAGGIPVAFLPGDATPDADLEADSTLPPEAARRLWGYLTQGGIDNAEQFLRYAAALLGDTAEWREPAPLPPAGVLERPWRDGAPVAAVVFYRALVQSGNLEPIEGLCDALAAQGLNPLPVHVASLKDPLAAAILGEALDRHPPDIVLNCTGFAVASAEPQFGDRPVLQVVLASGDEGAWRDGTRGLGPRDVAMNVALPEVDGRIITRAVSFKAALARDSLTQADVVTQRPVPDRCAFVAELAAAWVRLRRAPPETRRIALVLANYPNRDGRLGNGVGLDTPASTVGVLGALAGAGYDVAGAPEDGAALMALIQAGPTNDLVARPGRSGGEDLALPDYHLFFSALPDAVQKAVRERWGPPEADPHFRPGELDCGRFVISAIRFGKVAVAVQPARGYNIDPVGSFHDPALVPPHGYLAFYAWLRREFHAVVHMGKHGNLEWLPGKGLALSAECFPEVALGPMPHLYPFIVNDPGEGTQAKRRAQAVIIDHLTPPLTRAETYGPLREIEQLVDEYWEAAQLDPRRLPVLTREIATLARASGLDIDCGVAPEDGERALLAKLDSKLCELKELQIRDGLHVFGRSPEGRQLVDLLVALTRTPRGGRPQDASLIRALADDLKLGFDPLDEDL
ncbi:MAG: cobaltochelatase subunit CobN, partial [Alphaproteobacteria bacterium]|nr:cobaltochelatase subunit CobN [Alphaproteobacteria bacterium]